MLERNAETQSGMLLDFCNVAANKTISPSQTNGSLVGFVDVLLADCETVHTAVGLGMIWTLPRLAVQYTVALLSTGHVSHSSAAAVVSLFSSAGSAVVLSSSAAQSCEVCRPVVKAVVSCPLHRLLTLMLQIWTQIVDTVDYCIHCQSVQWQQLIPVL